MLANTLAEYFTKGGPIMYPIALVAIILFAVVAERRTVHPYKNYP